MLPSSPWICSSKESRIPVSPSESPVSGSKTFPSGPSDETEMACPMEDRGHWMFLKVFLLGHFHAALRLAAIAESSIEKG